MTRGAVGFEVLNPLTGVVLGKVGKRLGADKSPISRVTGVSSVWEGACLASRDMAVLSCSESGRMRLHASSKDSEGADDTPQHSSSLSIVCRHPHAPP